MLKDVFFQSCLPFTRDLGIIESHWEDIVRHYSEKGRHYHNLDHLINMLKQLDYCQPLIEHWDCVNFALFYHDFIYSATSKDNEEKSAKEGRKKLSILGVPDEKISLVDELILATKTHVLSTNNDVNLFTDADLSILGSSESEYITYYKQVRKEYSIYPDLLYKPGRKKVLQHFLDMPFIFKTTFFRERLEAAARRNIEKELKEL